MSKKLLTALLLTIVATVIFIFGYLYGGKFNVDQSALISRFVKGTEVHVDFELITKLSAKKLSYPTLSSDGKSLLYYQLSEGDIHEFGIDGTKTRHNLLQKLPPLLKDFSWSKDKSKIVASNGVVYSYFDLFGNSREISSEIKNLTFSPFSDQAAYVRLNDNGVGEVGVSDIGLISFKPLLKVGDAAWKASWLDQNRLLVSHNKATLFILDSEDASLRRLVSGENLETNSSPNGSRILYSRQGNAKGVNLFVLDMNQGISILLPLRTPASECTWSNDNQTIYCAVAELDKSDGFYKVSLTDYQPHKLKTNSADIFQAEELILSSDENWLYFKNIFDETLYRLDIRDQS